MSQPRIAFLGAGSMGGAIAQGLLNAGYDSVVATHRTSAGSDALAAAATTTGAQTLETITLETEPDANTRAAASADVIVLGVKPYAILDLVREIAGSVRAGSVVVSIAAGIPITAIKAQLADGVAVVRAMPNTPTRVGLGITGVAAGSGTSNEQLELVTQLFEAVGEVLVVDESQIDALSTISGSGPAYVFLLIEELTGAAERLGFGAEQAATLVQGTFRGACELLAREQLSPEDLRRRVTSPNGTTERAIEVLQEARLGELFDRATAAALSRSRELATD